MPLEQNYNRELLSYLTDVKNSYRVNPLILGGSTGSGGGAGTPPGGFVGQLAQIYVAGDSDESFLYSSGSVSSLLDNLNNIRAWVNPPKNFWVDETDPVSTRLLISSGSWYYQDGLAPLVYDGGLSPVISAPSSGSRYDLLTINSSGILSWISSAEGNPPTALPTFPQVTSQQIPLWMVVSRSSGSVVKRYDDGSNHYVFRDYRPFLGGPTYIPSTGSAFAVYRWQTDGYLASADDFNGVYYIPDNYALTGSIVWVKVPPSSGSVIVDVKYSGDYGASWSSIYSSLPTLTSGSYIFSTPNTITLSTGTLLKANIVNPGAGASTVSINLIGTVTSASGGGTVTSVSVSSTDGITSNVTNPNSTPSITLGLGDITPDSVSSSGSISGANLSGINTGDQYITLTGSVSGSGYTSIPVAISDTGVAPGVYTLATITVGNDGRILAATSGSGTAAIYPYQPFDVGGSSSSGSSPDASAGDHVHVGVHSVSTPGYTFSFGDVVLVAGSNVSITQSSGSFTINASGGSSLTSGSIIYTNGEIVSRYPRLDFIGGIGSFNNGIDRVELRFPDVPSQLPLDVGDTPATGSIVEYSPIDHIHRGVSDIIVSGHSAAYGEIEFFAGNGMIISQSSGSITFESTGSGGAASDAYYVTTQSSPELSNEVVHPELANYNPQYPPVSPSIYNDEFDDNTVDAKWTLNTYDASFNLFQTDGSLHLSESIYHGYITFQGDWNFYGDDFYQAFSPVDDDWTLVAKINPGYTYQDDQMTVFGVCGASSSGNYYQVRMGASAGVYGIRIIFDDGGGATEALNMAYPISGELYVMITKRLVGLNHQYSVFASGNGKVWTPMDIDRIMTTLTTADLTRQYFGMYTGGGIADMMASIDFVRYWNVAGKYDIGSNG